MRNIRLLDCTLRDGGFLNDWNFGQSSILSIFNRLVKSNIDVIEVGFIDGRRNFDVNRSINPSTKSFDEILVRQTKGNSLVLGMIDYGTCPIENISLASESFLDGIRVIFKKKDMRNAIEFCKQLKTMGYQVFANPVSITTYSDREMLELIDLVNELEPVAMSLVDTYGLLHKDRLFKYFYLLDNNLKSSIEIGYHSHNNFQLAYSNAIELLNIKTKRSIILDSSLYGMGKSAGNCNTELLAMYLNENYNKNYDMPEILNIIELEILKYLKTCSWGYQFSFYISALNDCHPSYVKYLEKKNMLPVKDLNSILCKIDADKKLTFNEQHIEALYQEHLLHCIDDNQVFNTLEKELHNRMILLLGPGNSLKLQENKIKEFIKKNNPVILSVNHINSLFSTDYTFISNPKRFDQFISVCSRRNDNIKLIITSNIEDNEGCADYTLNWGNLKSEETIVGESSLYLLMKTLIKLKVNHVVLAGFDGFSKITQNYYDSNYQFFQQEENIDDVTKAIIEQLANFQKYIKIDFLTKSNYSLAKEVLNV